MIIDYADQRTSKATELSVDLDVLRELALLAGVPAGTEVRMRVRDEAGAYGYTRKLSDGVYRCVVNVRYGKPELSESARYVVANTALHELRHVAQACEVGWHKLTGAYEGWSETEAREVGRSIKGDEEMYAWS